MKPGTTPAAEQDTALSPTEIARETLIQLASRRMAPTPDNFREIYRGIAGHPGDDEEQPLDRKLAEFIKSLPDANGTSAIRKAVEQALARRDWNSARTAILALARFKGGNAEAPAAPMPWPQLLRELIHGFEAGHAGWTRARKREALDTVLAGTADSATLLSRLETLIAAWKESEPSKRLPETEEPDKTAGPNVPVSLVAPLRECLITTLETALPGLLRHMPELAWEARALAARARQASSPELLGQLGGDLREFTQRIELQGGSDGRIREALLGLLRLLIDNIEQLVEGDHWIQDQVAIVRAVLERPLTPEVIDQAEQAIKDLMAKQSALKRSVEEAKANLKALLKDFIVHLGEMSEHTDGYQRKLEAHADKLEMTHDIGSINDIIRSLIRDTRDMKDTAEKSRLALTAAREHVRTAELRIQQMERELDQLTEQVREDQLTGTLNRRGLDEAFKREAGRADRQSTAMSVALLDIDNFKSLNDVHGHKTGDQALQHIVGVIKEHLRPADALARFGGEEFVVLLPDSDTREAVEVMTRLQRELTKRFFLHNNERLLITFSCGVTRRRSGEDLESSVERADRALYQAKRAGKNRVVVTDE